MVKPKQAIRLGAGDNVATAARDIAAGTAVDVDGEAEPVVIREPVGFGHKFALADILAGARVIKYGVAIGAATADIRRGSHVHLHNLRSLQEKGDENDAGVSSDGWKNRHT